MIWIISAVLLVLIASGSWWFWKIQTYHLETVQTGVLYRDGIRNLREYQTAIRKISPKVVVSLLDDDEMENPNEPQFKQEIGFLARNGIRLERIKVKLGGWPTPDDVKRFLEIVNNPQNQPVLVHCAQGVRRTGIFVAAYQRSVMKMDVNATRQAILAFGHSRRSIGDIEKFIDNYDPTTCAMIQTLPDSKE